MADSAGIPFTADQEFQAGFTCNGTHATPTTPLPFVCPASQFGSTLTQVPAPGTENEDHNPPRVGSRNLFDLAVGFDNLFKGGRYRWSAQLTFVNLGKEYALFNFLSTFSGTHYVSPSGGYGAARLSLLIYGAATRSLELLLVGIDGMGTNENATLLRVAWDLDATARIASKVLRLCFLFTFCPALLHHLRNTFAGRGTHMPPRTAGRAFATACWPASTTRSGRAESLQGCDRLVKPLAFSFQITEYVVNVHASPFGSLPP